MKLGKKEEIIIKKKQEIKNSEKLMVENRRKEKISLEEYCTQGEEGTESFVFRLIFDLFHLLVLVFLIWEWGGDMTRTNRKIWVLK